jgi:hypothetical protein
MISVFISYAHKDERLKERFLEHLAALKRKRLVAVWHDRMLKPGEHLNRAIEAELAQADLVILLVSANFINSDYCTEKEMQRAFARARDGRCKVAAVILKPCAWRDIPIDDEGGRLGDFLVTPRDGRAVTQWPRGQDAALHSAVEDIKRLITDESASGPVVQPRKRDDSSPSTDVRPRKRDDSSPSPDVIYPPTVTVTFNRDVLLADAILKVFRAYLQKIGARWEPRSVFLRESVLVLKEFRQAALDGRLPIWAKRRDSLSNVWEAIPKGYWKRYQISFPYLGWTQNPDPTELTVEKEGKFRSDGDRSDWLEPMTSSSVVDALWPPKSQ